jgi:hypothetical protein
MTLIIDINAKKDYEKVSEGVHIGVLADIVDLGMQPSQYGEKHKVRLVWLTDEVDSQGYTKRAFETYTFSLHEKADLRKRLEPIAKENKITIPSSGKFDVDVFIGVNRQLVIQHNENQKGDVFANVSSTLALKPDMYKLSIPADFKRKDTSNGSKPAAKAAATARVSTVEDDDIPF